jgi:hypothetical protein
MGVASGGEFHKTATPSIEGQERHESIHLSADPEINRSLQGVDQESG